MCACDMVALTVCVPQVNNLLAKTLQMQQKVLQNQETAISKALASQSPQGTTVQTSPQTTLPVATTPAASVQPSKAVTSTVTVTSQTSVPAVQDPPSQTVPVSVAIPATVPVVLTAGETSETSPASSLPSQAGPATSTAGKAPVFIHIISKSYLAVSTHAQMVKLSYMYAHVCTYVYTYCTCTQDTKRWNTFLILGYTYP